MLSCNLSQECPGAVSMLHLHISLLCKHHLCHLQQQGRDCPHTDSSQEALCRQADLSVMGHPISDSLYDGYLKRGQAGVVSSRLDVAAAVDGPRACDDADARGALAVWAVAGASLLQRCLRRLLKGIIAAA